jgi:formate dehydrogenase major subunit
VTDSREQPDRPGHAALEPITADPPPPPAVTPLAVTLSDVTFLHWRYEPSVVRPLMPPGTEPDTFDPRFTRTSALADIHLPLRAGSDIAFLGGLINYVLEHDKWFHEYVVAYTNAPMILREDFRDTEDLDGLFSGFDAGSRHYDPSTWQYEGADVAAAAGQRDQWATRQKDREGTRDEQDEATSGAGRRNRDNSMMETSGSGGGTFHGKPRRDDTLAHPRWVFQVLKRHFSRYTPEVVAQICGITEREFLRVADALTSNSGRERASAFVYAVGWTHHTVGVRYIRTAAILQLLLGNIGPPGGGIMALRGHASIQGSTDIPTLFNILPGYLPMPHAHEHLDLASYVAPGAGTTGFWGNMTPTPSACSRRGGVTPRPPTTTSASPTCRG